MFQARLPLLATLAIALSIAAAIAVREAGTVPPTLIAPLAIGEATWIADGGSVYFVIEDEVGATVLIGIKGSLEVPRTQFPLVFQRWYGIIPFGWQVRPGSSDEARILLALRGWLSALPESAAYRKHLEGLERTIAARHPTASTIIRGTNAA